jgi:hypothetical protein
MAYAQLIRAWQGSRRPARCRLCGHHVVWVLDDRGRNVPLSAHPNAIRNETDDKGRRFDIFEPIMRHDCRPKLKGFERVAKKP